MNAEHTFHLTISTVGETFFDGPAISATFPGSAGELTILANHEPFVTTLKQGNITVKTSSGETKKFPAESGVLECSHNRATVLL